MNSLDQALAREPEPQDARVRRAELIISGVLRAGVLTSLLLILTGTLVTFLHHPEYASSPAEWVRLTRPGAATAHTLREVATGILAFRGQAIVAAGLLVLILTPVLRVAVSILAFVAQRDRTYVVITSVVLLLLLLSFVLGRPSG
jgi:uncharacterized membrane protein